MLSGFYNRRVTLTAPGEPRRILNISAYLFVALPDAAAQRERLLTEARSRRLKGTVLLAEEGINLFLAGAADDVHGFVAALRATSALRRCSPRKAGRPASLFASCW